MKLNGISIKIERETIIPIISKDETFYLIAKPLSSYDGFDEVCARPVPRMGGVPGKERPMIEAKEYRDALTDWSNKFNEWVILASLQEIADDKGNRSPVEWEEVDMTNPDTFLKWKDELLANGFSVGDLRRIELEVWRCNQMDEQMIEAAKNHFLAITKGQATT
jgi:hypothetical protein